MHIGHIPRDTTVSKPKTGFRGQMAMRAAMALKGEQKITITRTRQSIPLSREIPDRRAVNRRSRSNETVIFLRRRFRIGEEVTRIVNQAIILFRSRIGIGKIIAIRRVCVQGADQRTVIKRSRRDLTVEIRSIITNIETRRHSEK
jgi:hypothetical protein